MKTSTKSTAAALITVLALAGCSKSGTTPSTTTSAASPAPSTAIQSPAQSSAQPSTATSAPSNTAALDQYQVWTRRYYALARQFMNAASAGDFTKAANTLELIGAHAKQGKALPTIGSAAGDEEWHNAMDDLMSAAAIGAPAIRAHDTDKLLDAVELISQAGDHITSWANQFG